MNNTRLNSYGPPYLLSRIYFDALPDRDPLRKPHCAITLARLRRQGELPKKSILMAISLPQLQRNLSDLVERVDDLDLVVNGDAARDVAGVRPRLSAVEQLTQELAEARKLDAERWKGLSRGLIIGLSVTSLGSIVAAVAQLLPYLHGVLP